MADDYRSELDKAQASIKDRRSDLQDPDDADRLIKMDNAYDPEKFNVKCPENQQPKAVTTRIVYLNSLARIGTVLPLHEATPDQWNNVFQAMYDGDSPIAKDSGLTKGTVRNYQMAARQFVSVFPEAADPEEITLVENTAGSVDPDDMLTREEIHTLRDSANCMRDLALIDFLLYTGQRNTATRSLRIKDLDLENGRFRLNEDIDGLKGAAENGTWRDLLLSQATLRKYLNTEHPSPDNPDAYVFCGRPSYSKVDPTEMLSNTTLGEILKRVSKRAAEDCPSLADKPTYPHALRHNFVTIALRRGLKEHTIKQQIGHNPGSNVMETTYAHLSDEDHIQAAREAFGLETEETENEHAPEQCPRCSTPQPAQASMCGVCHLEFSMDAKEAGEEIEDRLHDGKGETAAEGDEKAEAGADKARELINEDPEAKQAVMEELKDEIMADLKDELGD